MFLSVFSKTRHPHTHLLPDWQSVTLTTWMPHLFEGLLFTLAELLIFKFPLTEFSLKPLDALTQCKFVSGEYTKTQHTLVIFNTPTALVPEWLII